MFEQAFKDIDNVCYPREIIVTLTKCASHETAYLRYNGFDVEPMKHDHDLTQTADSSRGGAEFAERLEIGLLITFGAPALKVCLHRLVNNVTPRASA